MKQINYYVIGGQYESCCYGGTPTLIGVKDWLQKIWSIGIIGKDGTSLKFTKAEDTEIIISRGRILTDDGTKVRVPKGRAEPIV